MTALLKRGCVALGAVTLLALAAAPAVAQIEEQQPQLPGPEIAEIGVIYDGPRLPASAFARYIIFRGPQWEVLVRRPIQPPPDEVPAPQAFGATNHAERGTGVRGGALEGHVAIARSAQLGGGLLSPFTGAAAPNRPTADQLVSELRSVQEQLGL